MPDADSDPDPEISFYQPHTVMEKHNNNNGRNPSPI
jgi:hypothetical protein